MIGGDEVNAVVVDIGSWTTKAGYAGEDTPKAVFPSWVGMVPGESLQPPNSKAKQDEDTEMKDADEANDAEASQPAVKGNGDGKPAWESEDKRLKPRQKYYVGTSALNYRRDDMEVLPAMKNGAYDNWDIVEAIWDAAFEDRLRLNVAHHPMMLAEPSNNPKPAREKIVELMFEKYGPPALFLGKNAALASFSAGRQTSLVMDCGYEATTLAAVHDGYVLQKSICRAPIGGATLNRCMQSSVEQSSGTEIRPRYAFKRREISDGNFEVTPLDFPKTTESFKRYMKELIAADIKETICRVHETAFDEEQNKNIPTVSYELPDGQEIQIGSDRFKVPEVMFQPSFATSFKDVDALKTDGGVEISSLPQMVLESINKCDVDVRKELCNGVLLTGGTSLMPQLRERLERELAEQVSNTRVKVMTSASAIERKFSVWIGGSILASLGTFQQMWMSKSEYEEHGASLIHRKAP